MKHHDRDKTAEPIDLKFILQEGGEQFILDKARERLRRWAKSVKWLTGGGHIDGWGIIQQNFKIVVLKGFS